MPPPASLAGVLLHRDKVFWQTESQTAPIKIRVSLVELLDGFTMILG